jgi:hypothetical protein
LVILNGTPSIFLLWELGNLKLFQTVYRFPIPISNGIGDICAVSFFIDFFCKMYPRVFIEVFTELVWVLLDDVSLNILRKMRMQLDGAPANFSYSVRNYLYRKFSNKWISRNGACQWPRRCPDLTVMDFFVARYKKSCIQCSTYYLR